jgi:hypothetical protein
MVKWLLLVGDGGKTQTKSESHWIGVYLYREPTVRQNPKNPANRAAANPVFDTHVCACLKFIPLIIFFTMMIYIYTHYLLLALYICTGACRNRNHLPLLRPARYRIHQFYKLRSNKVP